MAPHEVEQARATAARVDAAPSSDKNALFEYAPPPYFGAQSRVPKWLQPWIADAFMFVVYHYNLWAVPVLAFFYYLYYVRTAMCVLLLLLLLCMCELLTMCMCMFGCELELIVGSWDHRDGARGNLHPKVPRRLRAHGERPPVEVALGLAHLAPRLRVPGVSEMHLKRLEPHDAIT